MRGKSLWLLCPAILGALLLAQAAPAATFYGLAEDGRLSSSTTQCTPTEHQSTSGNYTTIDCTGAGTAKFVVPVVRPFLDQLSWPKSVTAKIHYETPDTSSNVHCDWDISFYVINTYLSSGTVFPATVNSAPDNTTAVTSTTQTHAADTRYITPATSTVTIRDNSGTADCSNGSQGCADGELLAVVEWDQGSSTATECRFRMVEVSY